MKKLLIAILVLGLLAGCSSKTTKSNTDEKKVTKANNPVESKPKAEQKQEESKYPFPTAADIGSAKLTLHTPAGDSSGGAAPVLFVKPDDAMIQIGADLEKFQGDKQTFIYVDKIFKSTEQAGELTQTNVNLEGSTLKTGLHTVTAVQFENDDPNGKVINFVEAKYEVKASK